MANYICINQYDKSGELAISRKVFAKIALDAIEHASLKSTLIVKEPIKVIFKKDGKVIIGLRIIMKKGKNIDSTCKELQQVIAQALEVYVESIPFEIEISIDEIK